MDIQYKYILKVWISNTKIFFKHGYSLQIYTSYMDIQYKYTLQTWKFNTNINFVYGYPKQIYSLNMDIQYKDIPQNADV